jgi:hypothetical protein
MEIRSNLGRMLSVLTYLRKVMPRSRYHRKQEICRNMLIVPGLLILYYGNIQDQKMED